MASLSYTVTETSHLVKLMVIQTHQYLIHLLNFNYLRLKTMSYYFKILFTKLKILNSESDTTCTIQIQNYRDDLSKINNFSRHTFTFLRDQQCFLQTVRYAMNQFHTLKIKTSCLVVKKSNKLKIIFIFFS